MEENNTIHTSESLSRLSREELRQQLAAQLQKNASEINVTLVALLRKELKSRDPDPAFSDDTAVEVACEKFRRNTETAQKTKKHRYRNRWIAAASVVLVMGLLFFTLPATAQARDIQGVLTWWTEGMFQFFDPGNQPNAHAQASKNDHSGLQLINDTLTELGITDPVVPSWVPEGFALIELKTNKVNGDDSVVACLVNGDRSVFISIVRHDTDATAFQHEKNENGIIDIWDLSGNEHYIISNMEQFIVTWVTNGIECTITSDCTEEEVYSIVKSIYTSED